MVDPIAVVVDYLSDFCPNVLAVLSSLSPSAGFDIRDHIQGGNDLPAGWKIDRQGPVVLVTLQGGPFALEDVPLINARIVTQSYGATDEEASQVARALLDDFHDTAGPGFTFSRADAPPQVIPDRTSEWRIGVTYYNVRVRMT